MAYIALPTDLQVHQLTWGQKDYTLTLANPDTGAQQTRMLAPPRWTAVLNLNMSVGAAQMAVWKSMLSRLRGKTNQLELYDIKNPAPRGTARGIWTSSGTLAVGATSMAVQAQRLLVNYIRYSEELQQASKWVVGAATVTANAVTTPVGDSTGDHLAETAVTAQHTISQSAFLSVIGTSYTISVHLRAAERGFAFFGFNGTGTLPFISVNLTTGVTTLVNGSVTAHGATDAGAGGWWRVFMTVTSADALDGVSVRISTDGVWANRSYLGVAAQGIYVWGADYRLTSDYDADPAYQRVGADASTFDKVSYVNVGKTILNGDWVGVGSGATRQLVMVTADVTLDATASGTVTFEAPSRYAQAASYALTWDKPTCLMRSVESDCGWASDADAEGSVALNLVESWE